MNRIGHAYLFCGTRGTGKTSIAKIFAKAVNCEHPVNGSPCNECAMCRAVNEQRSMNVIEIDAASNNGVDNIREIREEVAYSPSEGKYKVYIIDEVHMLSIGAFNALLKTLEEPPSYVIFILATTEAHKIPITILSRCQRYDFRRISTGTIAERLRELADAEGIDAEDAALAYVARMADGSMRDALSLLDQCNAFYIGQRLKYENVLDVLGAVDTENYSYGELFNEVNARTGGISYGIEVFDDAQDTDAFRAMFAVRGKALYPEMDFMFSMIREVLTTSKLTDTKRLYEIIARVKSRAQASLASAGHSTAVLRGASYASPMAAFQDEMAGIGYYQFIEKLEKDFDSCKDEIVKNLRKVMEEVLRPENFCVSYTGERESLDTVKTQAAEIKKVLFNGQKPEPVKQAPCVKKNEAFKTSGQVQYVAQNGNFRKKGLEYTGALEILKVILSYDYLWINLRVKGGAYGCMSGFKRNGESFLVSYRDPHLKRTLEVYQGVPDYIRAFEADEREMTKYIIGTISNKDVPRTPQMQGSISKTAYFSNVTEDMLQKERNQILGAQKEDIQKLAALVEAVLSDDQICVVGSETAIEKAEDVFMEVKPLIG